MNSGKTILALAAAAMLAGACSKKSSGVKLRADVDSVAYVIGMNVGANLLRMDSTLNAEIVCEGIRDAFRRTARLSPEEAETFFLSYMIYALPTSDRDSVAVRWVIRTPDGGELYSSYTRGDTLRMALSELTRGVRESVKLIGKGGRITTWIPSAQAYGAEGDAELGVAPNTTLCYEIELVEVDKYADRRR